MIEVTIDRWQGEQDGKDGYDAIEHIAQLPWCTGKIGTAGNSWLAMCQWFIAAEKPPHLAAIAPWEGAADFYRDTLARGGVPYPYDTMWGLLQNSTAGRNGIEAVISMLEQYPLYNEYWDDKRAKLDNIITPAYVLASYSSALHTTGSIRGFNAISSQDKW
jgi:predicted acyl esterase